ncbi:hypothetical protein R6Q59_013620 [Mikania micrantha]
MVPTIIEAVRNPNPNPNSNAKPNANANPVPMAGNNVGANQNVGIHDSVVRSRAILHRSFIKAATLVEAKDWISHIEKIFRVLGVENQYMSRLAAYKLEEAAQNWWESILLEKGGNSLLRLYHGMSFVPYSLRIAEAVKDAKRIEMERKEFLSGSDDSRKRNRDGNRIQSSSP